MAFTEPPSTFKMTPVHQEPAFEAKYIHAPVISSSFPIRPNGVAFAIVSGLGPQVPKPADMRLGTKPGARQLTGNKQVRREIKQVI